MTAESVTPVFWQARRMRMGRAGRFKLQFLELCAECSLLVCQSHFVITTLGDRYRLGPRFTDEEISTGGALRVTELVHGRLSVQYPYPALLQNCWRTEVLGKCFKINEVGWKLRSELMLSLI